MANPLEENVTAFVESVFNNETLLQSERKQMIKSALLSLQRFVERGVDRNGMSIQFGDRIRDARQLRKKNRSEE